MREIKFRAWNKKEKRMTKGTELCRVIANWHGLNEEEWKDVEIMQFTGLKDKNGKDIYEGDIIERTRQYNSHVSTGKVIFRKGKFEVDYGNLIFFDFKENNTNDMILEIIGNIHSNPELLNYSPSNSSE